MLKCFKRQLGGPRCIYGLGIYTSRLAADAVIRREISFAESCACRNSNMSKTGSLRMNNYFTPDTLSLTYKGGSAELPICRSRLGELHGP